MMKNKFEFHGENLRFARLFNGFSLPDLGEKVSASRQYIQKLETDPDTTPADDMLLALSVALDFDLGFFSIPVKSEVREEDCHFRKLKTTPVNVRNRALTYGTIFSMIVSYLEKEFDLPTVNICSDFEHDEPMEKVAEKCRKYWGLGLSSPIDSMTRVIENNGGVVTTFKDVSEKVDAFSYVRARPIVVRSTGKKSRSRARFDLAHELGHMILHQGIEAGDPILDEQANRFASAFLLPRVAFLSEFSFTGRFNWSHMFDLKKRWGVSLAAIIRRAYDLEIIDALQYRNANIYISKRGWKTNEPYESCIKEEKPEIVNLCFDQLEKAKGITPADVAKHLYLRSWVFEKFNIKLSDNASNVVSLQQYR